QRVRNESSCPLRTPRLHAGFQPHTPVTLRTPGVAMCADEANEVSHPSAFRQWRYRDRQTTRGPAALLVTLNKELAGRATPFPACRGSVPLRDWIVAGAMWSAPGIHPMTCSPTVAELSSPPWILEVKVDDTPASPSH